MRNIIVCVCVLILGTSVVFAEAGKSQENAFISTLISNSRITSPVDFCGEKMPVEDPEIRENIEKEMLLFLGDPAQVVLWLKRCSRYMPYIERMLKQNNMPDDLKYVAVIESSLLPHAGSAKHAIGFWQFIQPTGLRVGMTINSEIDERRSIFTSTVAAIKYFKKLYSDFGAWTLAAAAYNMGEEGLRTNIAFQETNDYYRLYLPIETQRYMYKIVAAKLILSDPKKYGFSLEKDDLYPPLDFDRIQVECPDEVPITLIAKAANTHFKTIKDFNPEMRGKSMSAGTYSFLIPKGGAEGFDTRYKTLLSQWLATGAPKKKEVQSAEMLAQPEPDDQPPAKIKKRGKKHRSRDTEEVRSKSKSKSKAKLKSKPKKSESKKSDSASKKSKKKKRR